MFENQQGRLLVATAQASYDVGYEHATVEEITHRAGVSRRTFYDHFENREAAFLAAHDEAMERAFRMVVVEVNVAESFAVATASGITALIELAVNEPAFAWLALVDVQNAGLDARQRRVEFLDAFASLVHHQAHTRLEDPPPPLVAEVISGGIYNVIAGRVERRQSAHLAQLAPQILYCALLPYLGHAAASQERAEFARHPRGGSVDGSADAVD